MADDIVIRAEGLGKKYVIGHETERERYTALRDVIARGVRNAWAKTRDMAHGRAIVAGDTTEEFWALKDVSFEVKRGEVLGIIGRNGAGKSTLLKILSRITEPTEGRVTIHGRVASLLEVGTGFHPELTGRENIYLNGAILGMTHAEIKRKFDEIVAFAEVERFLDTPVKRYSSGMYVRLAFAVAAHLEPEILIVDEVLAVGDAEFQKKCLGKMQDVAGHGRTVLFVSHNLDAARRICEHGLLLDRGRIAFSASIGNCVDRYISDYEADATTRVLFPLRDDTPASVRAISILDARERPAFPTTGGSVRFRIHIRSSIEIQNASAVIYISTSSGVLLSLLSTKPDSNRMITIPNGDSYIDLYIEKLMISSGIFSIGAGLAIPNIKWIYNISNAGYFRVIASDIFSSGLPPAASRYPVPLIHSWGEIQASYDARSAAYLVEPNDHSAKLGG